VLLYSPVSRERKMPVPTVATAYLIAGLKQDRRIPLRFLSRVTSPLIWSDRDLLPEHRP
jgi:hypothetical protein